MLEQAELALRDTDDHITLGNIYSAHGRMIRRQGRYNEALKYFAKAIDHYQKLSLQHRNLARSLANIAYVQRLIAQHLVSVAAGEPDVTTSGRRGLRDRLARALDGISGSPGRDETGWR